MAGNQINILMVEDNPGDVKLVSMMLADAKGATFHVETCDRLATGLERLAKGGIDVLLLDLSLPDSHGFETFDKAHAASPLLPIVLLSNLDDEKIALRAVEMGAQDYLIKGQVDSPSLGRAIRFAVERQKKQAAQVRNEAAAVRGKVLVLVGAKGGVGTTTVALNMAACVAEAKKSVIVAELRQDYGTFSQHLRHTPSSNLSSLIALDAVQISESEISSRLVRFPSGLKVLFGPQAIKEFQEISPEKTEALLAGLARMADYVIIDLPDVTAAASQIAARHCSFAALVLDSDPLSVASGHLVLEQLSVAGVSRALMRAVVVNRSAALTGVSLSEISKQLDCEVFGVVTPAAEMCLRAQKSGTPFVLSEPESLASGAIADMVYRLLALDKVEVVA